MAALCGVHLINNFYVGYRTTKATGRGRYITGFMQDEGWYYEDVPTEPITCIPGIHITNMAIAHNFFYIDPNAQLWEVKVKPEDLLACDGQKCRIRGGYFTKINTPFFR